MWPSDTCVYIIQLFCHCVLIYFDFHCQLVCFLCNGCQYCFYSVAESYETIINLKLVDHMINALQSMWNLDQNSLHAFVCQWLCASPFDVSFPFYFFSVSGLPQSFDVSLECLHFSHTTGCLHYNWWMIL